MTLRRYLQDSFSPYELSVLRLIIASGLGLTAMLALFLQKFGIGILLLLITLPIGIALGDFARCPSCGKSPLSRARGELSWVEYYLTRYSARHWPEKTCSRCGYDLQAG